jgi:hypothetical protein
MSGFLYFLPEVKAGDLHDRSKLNRDLLARWKLDHVLSDCSIVPEHLVGREAMIEDKPGVILTTHPINGDQVSWGYQPSRQEWRPAGDGSGKLIGWRKDSLPSPEGLKKRTALISKWVIQDARGNEWELVTARSSDSDAGMLPCDFAWRDGKMVSIVNPTYRSLFDLSGDVYDHYAAVIAPGDDGEFSDGMKSEEFLALAAVSVLGVNYRLGIAEVTALQELGYSLVSTENIGTILSCFIDRPLLEEFIAWNRAKREKKTQDQVQDSASCSSGQEGCTKDTSPQDVASSLLK